jgi:hypothetical protein
LPLLLLLCMQLQLVIFRQPLSSPVPTPVPNFTVAFGVVL